MNPDSDSIVELGTIDHPYKQLSYAFVEILNYHSHSDYNLTLYIMEDTTSILGFKQGNIINITNVHITSYSLTLSEPGKATIVAIDEHDIVPSPSTLFNVMKTFELRMDEQVTNNMAITEQERLNVGFNDYNILVLR